MRTTAAMLATGFVFAACGAAEDTTPASEPVADTAAPAADDEADLTQNEGSSTEGDAVAEPEPAVATAPAETSAATEAPAADEPAATEAPPATEAAAPAPVEAVLGGRSFASELSAESDFAENILPDLQVDDIRSGQKVNFRNIFPAERPVLIWAWAPH